MTHTQEARKHHGIPEWELVGPARRQAELADGIIVIVMQLDYAHPQGEHSATVQWHSEDSTEVGVYRTLREAQAAAYDAVVGDFADYLRAYDAQCRWEADERAAERAVDEGAWA